MFPRQYLALHASSIAIEGNALLFLGHSTSGKSTIASRLGSEYLFLADDTVQVWQSEPGRILVRDGKNRNTPLSPLESDGFDGLPLHGCYRIYKGTELRVESLPPITLAQHLMDAVMEVDVQRKYGRIDPKDATTAHTAISEAREMRKKWFALVAIIARTYTGGKLWFPRDVDPATFHKLILP